MVGGLVGLFDLMRPDQRKLINKDASEWDKGHDKPQWCY
jgi:hypothetical protein